MEAYSIKIRWVFGADWNHSVDFILYWYSPGLAMKINVDYQIITKALLSETECSWIRLN